MSPRLRIAILVLAALSAAGPCLAVPQPLLWETCHGVLSAEGPVLSACRPGDAVIDPQRRELWLRASVGPPPENQLYGLQVIGPASSQAWLNGRLVGLNGRPASSRQVETPGRYEAMFPIPDGVWRPKENTLVVRLSGYHSAIHLDRPMGAVRLAPYPPPSSLLSLALVFTLAGALLAGAFGFGVVHRLRRTGSSRTLALMASVAGVQAMLESLRILYAYPYPVHAWRLLGIWAMSSAFSALLVAYIASRFWPKRAQYLIGVAFVAVAATSLAPGFDTKTVLTLMTGVAIALAAAFYGMYQGSPGARPTTAYLFLFLLIAMLFPTWVVDVSYFVFAAGLLLPLLMAEVVRLATDDRAREKALTRAAGTPDCLTVASIGQVERIPLQDIVGAIGADDYVELRIVGGRSLLHATRLDQLETELSTDFLRVHRSAIANLGHVVGLRRHGRSWRLELNGGLMLPISRRRFPSVRARVVQGQIADSQTVGPGVAQSSPKRVRKKDGEAT